MIFRFRITGINTSVNTSGKFIIAGDTHRRFIDPSTIDNIQFVKPMDGRSFMLARRWELEERLCREMVPMRVLSLRQKKTPIIKG
ncbi:MAG: hypothetical protein QG552_2517 [Thermodesulfobacteriota bacterium]|nr:hypothetical protein [Thermodesulfobacteriota bacterium]